MTRPMVYFYDGNTDESITREMNDEEYAQSLIDKDSWKAQLAAEQA